MAAPAFDEDIVFRDRASGDALLDNGFGITEEYGGYVLRVACRNIVVTSSSPRSSPPARARDQAKGARGRAPDAANPTEAAAAGSTDGNRGSGKAAAAPASSETGNPSSRNPDPAAAASSGVGEEGEKNDDPTVTKRALQYEPGSSQAASAAADTGGPSGLALPPAMSPNKSTAAAAKEPPSSSSAEEPAAAAAGQSGSGEGPEEPGGESGRSTATPSLTKDDRPSAKRLEGYNGRVIEAGGRIHAHLPDDDGVDFAGGNAKSGGGGPGAGSSDGPSRRASAPFTTGSQEERSSTTGGSGASPAADSQSQFKSGSQANRRRAKKGASAAKQALLDEAADLYAETAVDLVYLYNLQELTWASRGDFSAFLKGFVRRLLRHLDAKVPDRADGFGVAMASFVKHVLARFTEWRL